MRIKELSLLYFSPTGTTKKIVETIAGAIQCDKKETVDFTKRKTRESAAAASGGDLTIIGSPVYYGRLPAEVARYLSKINVANVPAILVVVYGNREHEDSLRELYDISSAAGFLPIAWAAFIGEHSYSSEKLPMAPGRPDMADLEKAKLFGAAIQEEMGSLISHAGADRITLPGSSDYRNKTMPKFPVVPGVKKEQCTMCKTCIEVCPAEAIAIDSQSSIKTDINLCILCFACVKNCPSQARGIDDAIWSQAMEGLQKKCLERKEPEIYLKGIQSLD